MNYPLKSSRRARTPFRPVAILAIILVSAILVYILLGRAAGDAVAAIARPLFLVRDSISRTFGNAVLIFEDRVRLADENARLTQSLNEAQAALQTLNGYKNENDSLKAMLGRPKGGMRRAASAILAKPPRSLYDTLILDAGTNAGVAVGDRVMSGDFIIGVIQEAGTAVSKASLFSSSGQNVQVVIGNKGIAAEAQGQGGGNFLVKLPKEVPVNIGDVVRLPGLDPVFFGAVADIEETVAGSFQFIRFTLPVNVNELNYVEIMKNQ